MSKRQGRTIESIYLVAIIAIFMTAFTVSSYAQYNGECWAADYYNIYKISTNGQATTIPGFSQPLSLSINPTDGSVWVADTDAVRVRKLSATGQDLFELNSTSTPPAFTTNPRSVSVDPRDGSCWVAVFDKIYKYSADGKELFKLENFGEPVISVNPTNGQCWVADANNFRVVRFSPDGKQLGQTKTAGKPNSISVNPTDNSCWVLDTDNHRALKIAADGSKLVDVPVAPGTRLMASTFISASSDGGCWIALAVDMVNDWVIKLSADGTQVLKVEGFNMPSGLAFDPGDQGCWVADTNLMDPTGGRIVKLSADGQRVTDIAGFSMPKVLAVALMK